MSTEAGFVGQRFCIFHPAQGGTNRGSVLYVHPFAEEMNKARRMATLQARALAACGHDVLQIDLLGCGDSSGDFGDATWSGWIDDVRLAAMWLRHRASTPLWLWGMRAGCLLIAEAAEHIDAPTHFLFWQPALSGKLLIQQFLRLRIAADMLAGHATDATQTMRRQLDAGESIDIAGYSLSSALAAGLERATLRPPSTLRSGGRMEWIELSSRAEATLAPASSAAIEPWRRSGATVRERVVTGPSFWQTAEIEEAPQLLAATLAAIGDFASP
ncbi:MAG: hydrolase 2, exosortase A system-associated [Burkholderiaceae bacterium]